jgi:hypothetical protein
MSSDYFPLDPEAAARSRQASQNSLKLKPAMKNIQPVTNILSRHIGCEPLITGLTPIRNNLSIDISSKTMIAIKQFTSRKQLISQYDSC